MAQNEKLRPNHYPMVIDELRLMLNDSEESGDAVSNYLGIRYGFKKHYVGRFRGLMPTEEPAYNILIFYYVIFMPLLHLVFC